MTKREKKEKSARRNEKNEGRGKPTRDHTSTRLSKRSNILMVPTPTDVFHGWSKYMPRQIITTGIIMRNCYLTVVAVLPRQSTTLMSMLPQNK